MATIIVTSNEITALEVYICLVYVTLLHPVKHDPTGTIIYC